MRNEFITMTSVLSAKTPDDLERDSYEEQEGPVTLRNIIVSKPFSSGNLLRFTSLLCDGMNTEFVDSFTPTELVTLAQAYMASDDDVTPDNWTDEQIEAALKGEF